MSKESITFRLDAEKRAALDAIAASLDRDRSYVLIAAIETYIEIHQWEIDEIRKAQVEARIGDFATDGEVAAVHMKYKRR